MTAAGLETEAVTDILDHIWGKLLINVGINALTAIQNCPNGHLLKSAELKKCLAGAVREAAEVAKAKGVCLTEDPVAATLEVCKATGKNISSMLQDVRNKRLTEIDAINGAVIAEARLLEIPTPINEELIRQVHVIEKGYLEKFP
jgi:2-dehydropantoate 2-reductase